MTHDHQTVPTSPSSPRSTPATSARSRTAGPSALLEEQIAAFETLRALPEDKANHRYADGKWSVKEVIGHMADAERVFSYRLLRIARGDQTPLAGFDENAWAKTAPHGKRRMADVVDELIAVRRATLALVESLDERRVVATPALANNNPVTRPRDLLDHRRPRAASPGYSARALRRHDRLTQTTEHVTQLRSQHSWPVSSAVLRARWSPAA